VAAVARGTGSPAADPPFSVATLSYAIAYQALPGLVAVLAIVHERRKPLYWIGRAR
jgi:hypothetical protein